MDTYAALGGRTSLGISPVIQEEQERNQGLVDAVKALTPINTEAKAAQYREALQKAYPKLDMRFLASVT